MTPPPVGLLHYHLLLLPLHKDQPESRNGKEDGIHDAECPRGFEHGTLFIDVEIKPVIAAHSIGPQSDRKIAIIAEVRAIGVGDVAKVIDAGDQGANEAYVDERDEVGGPTGGFATEEGQSTPCYCKGGDDEEYSVDCVRRGATERDFVAGVDKHIQDVAWC